MEARLFEKRSRLPASADDAFAWHARPGALRRLTPPWETVEVVDPGPGVEDGARATIRVPVGPFWKTWVAEHRDVEPGRQFRDVQVEGPFAAWDHIHRFHPEGPDASDLEDRIAYALPLGPLGRLGGKFVRRKLARMFAWRHRTTIDDLQTWRASRDRPRQRVLVTGASGLVGSALSAFLSTQGHVAIPLPRGASSREQPSWDPAAGKIDLAPAGALDAVVHLAGENVAGGRWTDARKERIRKSRVEGTRLLAEALARSEHGPRVLVTASATGFYGDRGDEILTEASESGDGFLADVARAWEDAAEPAREAGIRVVHLRFGVVLTPAGGALAKMLPPFRFGVGGPLGSGAAFFPWVAIDDVLGAALHAILDDGVRGPVNVVAPQTVTGRDFAKALGRTLQRPAFARVPAWALRLAMGEMADEMLLASARVEPRALRESGYPFRFPDLDGALAHVLGHAV